MAETSDLISREKAIDLAYDCEDEFGKDVAFRLAYYLRQLPSAQPERKTGTSDLISRRAVELALIEKGQASKRYKLGEFWELNLEEIREALASVPSAQPEWKKGTWAPAFNGKFTGGAYWFNCSKCGRIVPEVRNGGWNFCPNCGADMRGEPDE